MKNKCKTISILGQPYQVIICSEDDMNNYNPRKSPSDNALNCLGLCDTEKKIIYLDSELLDNEILFNRVFRHEIIHALVGESGIQYESVWGQNEECIDFYANQFPKLLAIFDKLRISSR